MLVCQAIAVMAGTEKGAPKAWQIAAQKDVRIDRTAVEERKAGEPKPPAKLTDYTAETQLFAQLFPANARMQWVHNPWALQCLDLVLLDPGRVTYTCITLLENICSMPPLTSYDKIVTHGPKTGEVPSWRCTTEALTDPEEWLRVQNKYRLKTNTSVTWNKSAQGIIRPLLAMDEEALLDFVLMMFSLSKATKRSPCFLAPNWLVIPGKGKGSYSAAFDRLWTAVCQQFVVRLWRDHKAYPT